MSEAGERPRSRREVTAAHVVVDLIDRLGAAMRQRYGAPSEDAVPERLARALREMR